ncbi:MAG TPA: phosphoribosylaminoimidazolesuccinocarboxamide synthase [Candidatus Saccharimonadales bacterium]|nr:phosphoribosylaminoimidazolesuccinocarboxamide synthase [Candidatus Saccharimonadales bacterium]
MADTFVRSGKVRDLYELPDGRLALVASDRISAFDVVLPSTVPDKGRVLTGLSRFWFAETAGIIPNHLLGTDPAAMREAFVAADDTAAAPLAPLADEEWRGRVMVCRHADVVPVEAVVRGYLAGSGWAEYQATGSVCGVALPAGLRESDRLPQPIFTPATKAELGEHDQNIDFDAMVEHIGASWIVTPESAGPIAESIRDRAIALYRYAAAIAARAGIVLADTKFEFGLGSAWGAVDDDDDAGEGRSGHRHGRFVPGRRAVDRSGRLAADQLLLIDEVLTPDSSRLWDAATYEPGRAQASFDKQFVRDWLLTQPWDRTDPGPALPDDVIAGTRARYVEAFERITGASFDRYLAEDVIAR